MSLRSAFRTVIVFDDLIANFFDVPFAEPIPYTTLHDKIVEYAYLHGTDGLFMRRLFDLNSATNVSPHELPRYAWKYIGAVPEKPVATEAQPVAQSPRCSRGWPLMPPFTS